MAKTTYEAMRELTEKGFVECDATRDDLPEMLGHAAADVLERCDELRKSLKAALALASTCVDEAAFDRLNLAIGTAEGMLYHAYGSTIREAVMAVKGKELPPVPGTLLTPKPFVTFRADGEVTLNDGSTTQH